MKIQKLTAMLLAAVLIFAVVGCAGKVSEVAPEQVGDEVGSEQDSVDKTEHDNDEVDWDEWERLYADLWQERFDDFHASLPGTFETYLDMPSYDELLSESDLIVDVTILELICESPVGPIHPKEGGGMYAEHAYFKVKINNTIKGELYENITLRQDGNSLLMDKMEPVYKAGDRMLLFLKKDIYNEEMTPVKVKELINDYDISYDNLYWSYGAYVALFDLVEYNDKLYAKSRREYFEFSIDSLDEESALPVLELFDARFDREPLPQDFNYQEMFRREIYSYDDVAGEILRDLSK